MFFSFSGCPRSAAQTFSFSFSGCKRSAAHPFPFPVVRAQLRTHFPFPGCMRSAAHPFSFFLFQLSTLCRTDIFFFLFWLYALSCAPILLFWLYMLSCATIFFFPFLVVRALPRRVAECGSTSFVQLFKTVMLLLYFNKNQNR